MASIIQIRRDTAANWVAADPTLAEGEIGIETDSDQIKIGNGVDEWTALAYYGGGGVPEAPEDGTGYVRKDGAWAAESSSGGGIPDAPSDGNLYGRKDASWQQVPAGGSGDVVGPSSAVADRIAVFDGATGKLLKDGGHTIAQLRALALTSPENVQTGTTYTLVLADAFKLVTMANAAANTLTVPPNSAVAFPIGTRIDLGQDDAGQTTIAAGAGVTIRTPETLKLRKQWGKATLIKRAINTWDIEGNLEAAP